MTQSFAVKGHQCLFQYNFLNCNTIFTFAKKSFINEITNNIVNYLEISKLLKLKTEQNINFNIQIIDSKMCKF